MLMSFSSVNLTRLFPKTDLGRTRDKAWIAPDEGRIICDVGGDFDAAAQIFNHHQRLNSLRENGQPYCSFGLIWAQYGRDYWRAVDVPEKDVAATCAKQRKHQSGSGHGWRKNPNHAAT